MILVVIKVIIRYYRHSGVRGYWEYKSNLFWWIFSNYILYTYGQCGYRRYRLKMNNLVNTKTHKIDSPGIYGVRSRRNHRAIHRIWIRYLRAPSLGTDIPSGYNHSAPAASSDRARSRSAVYPSTWVWWSWLRSTRLFVPHFRPRRLLHPGPVSWTKYNNMSIVDSLRKLLFKIT